MLKAKGFITLADIDITKFERDFRNNMTETLKKLTKVWLMAATGKVPVWSGMALASLMKVSETIGGGLIVSPRSGVKSRVSLGKSLGSVKTKYGPRTYSINIKTRVPHYVLQDKAYIGASPTAPWGSFESGMNAVNSAKINIFGPRIETKRITF